jgi:hypothetical protein
MDQTERKKQYLRLVESGEGAREKSRMLTVEKSVSRAQSFGQLARTCGGDIVLFVAGVAVGCGLLGLAVEHFGDLLFVVSVGRQFWGAVAVGVAGWGAATWAMFVYDHLHGEELSQWRCLLVVVGTFAGLAVVLALIAIHFYVPGSPIGSGYRLIAVATLDSLALATGLLSISRNA